MGSAFGLTLLQTFTKIRSFLQKILVGICEFYKDFCRLIAFYSLSQKKYLLKCKFVAVPDGTPRHEAIWENGGRAPCIFNPCTGRM